MNHSTWDEALDLLLRISKDFSLNTNEAERATEEAYRFLTYAGLLNVLEEMAERLDLFKALPFILKEKQKSHRLRLWKLDEFETGNFTNRVHMSKDKTAHVKGLLLLMLHALYLYQKDRDTDIFNFSIRVHDSEAYDCYMLYIDTERHTSLERAYYSGESNLIYAHFHGADPKPLLKTDIILSMHNAPIMKALEATEDPRYEGVYHAGLFNIVNTLFFEAYTNKYTIASLSSYELLKHLEKAWPNWHGLNKEDTQKKEK